MSLRSIDLLSALAGVLALSAPAHAALGSLDRVPAATLLMPWFELAPVGAPRTDWFVAIASTSGSGQLAHATIWSDLGVPVFGFDLYLPAHGGVRLDLAAILEDGALPTRAPSDLAALGCVSSDFSGQVQGLADVQARLRGQAVGGTVVATADPRMRGYLTIEASNACTDLSPADPGYFVTGGAGVASDANVLFGDFRMRPASGDGFAEPLVHIEAFPDSPETNVAGQYTFYGSLDLWSAADNREPLATQWLTPALVGDELIVWRDPRRPPIAGIDPAGIAAASLPAASQIVAISPTGDVRDVTASTTLAAVTQRVSVALGDLDRASLWLQFGATSAMGAPEDTVSEQAYVIAIGDALRCGPGRAAHSAWAIDNASSAKRVDIPAPTEATR